MVTKAIEFCQLLPDGPTVRGELLISGIATGTYPDLVDLVIAPDAVFPAVATLSAAYIDNHYAGMFRVGPGRSIVAHGNTEDQSPWFKFE